MKGEWPKGDVWPLSVAWKKKAEKKLIEADLVLSVSDHPCHVCISNRLTETLKQLRLEILGHKADKATLSRLQPKPIRQCHPFWCANKFEPNP